MFDTYQVAFSFCYWILTNNTFIEVGLCLKQLVADLTLQGDRSDFAELRVT